jgi:riboflavin kinase/FMN adenylyltransferase
MELVRGLHNLRAQHRGCAVTIGNFDGVHLGHRATLERLREHARLVGQPATVLTFEPTPREFLSPARAPARLTRLREKLVLLERERVERCVVLRFDERLQRVRAGDFIERLLVARLGARRIVVGHDFRFGYRGEADVAVLQAAAPAQGFEVDVIEPLLLDGVRVSSTAVREALASGDLEWAARLLGRRYSMQGRVIAGERLGQKLGFPTANLRLHRRVAASSQCGCIVSGRKRCRAWRVSVLARRSMARSRCSRRTFSTSRATSTGAISKSSSSRSCARSASSRAWKRW